MSPPTDSPHLALVGSSIAGGRFLIVRLLGEGGMGAVYEARQQPMDRRVALKLIHPSLGRSAEAIGRFEREMRATTRVEHENTVRVYDFGESDGRLFLAMEFLDGRTLTSLLTEEPRLPPARALRIGEQILRGLSAAHREGLVHRDLKPENVMLLDRYGEPDMVKVVDFGIAKSLDDERTALTAAGGVIGTPRYMSPEQAMGRAVDARSDLYSFGVLLYEMLSGTAPFTSPSVSGLIVAHATEPPPPLGTVAPSLPPALAALVMQLLQKDPAARPQTALEVQQRLATSLRDDAIVPPTRRHAPAPLPSASPAPSAGVAPSWASLRRPMILAMVALLLVSGVVAWRILGVVHNAQLDAFITFWNQSEIDREGKPITPAEKNVVANDLGRLRGERDLGQRGIILMSLIGRMMMAQRFHEAIAVGEAMRAEPPTPPRFNYDAHETGLMYIVTCYQSLKDDANTIRTGEEFMALYPASTWISNIKGQVARARGKTR